MTRLVLLLVALVVLATPVTLAVPTSPSDPGSASATSHTRATPAPAALALDLAALSLNPDDLAAAGLPDFGEYRSAMLTIDEQARQVAPDLGLGAAAVRGALSAAGFERRYQRQLGLPQPVGDSPARPRMLATSYITQYGSAVGAAAGYTLLEAEAGTAGTSDLLGSRVIGEQSEVTFYREPRGNAESYRALDLTFRSGHLVAGITLGSFGAKAPDLAVVEALAERLLSRIEAAGTDRAPGLSNLALRLGGPDIESRADGYGRLLGETFPNFDESDEEFARRVARYGDAVDVYGVAQTAARGNSGRPDAARYVALLYGFTSDQDADAWLGKGLANALASPNVVSAVPVDGAATIGDASLTLAVTSARGSRTVSGYLIDTRVGPVVAQIELFGQSDVPLATVEDLARAQVECLRAGGCWERFAPPVELDPAVTGTPPSAAIATPTPAGPCGSTPPLATPGAARSTALGGETETPAADGSQPPNIILILTDDLDSRAVACLPNVQSLLAAQGISFSNAFVTTPLCCPSRASILRGQYAHNHGVINNSGSDGGFPAFYQRDNEASTIATWLHGAGYRTALFGKYLNRYPKGASASHVPPGWDEWSAFAVTRGEESAISHYFGYTLNTNGVLVPYGDRPEDYSTDVLAEQAIDFVRQSAAAEQPFFVYLAPYAPHGPSTPAPRHSDAFRDAGAPRVPSFAEADVGDKPAWVRAHPPLAADQVGLIDDRYRRRLRSLLAVDELVADLVETLRATGTLDSTYIVFTSDNGFHLGEHRLPIGKQSAYDESTRVPLIVRGPGVPAGATASQLALNIDLAPTFADLTGVAPPDFVDGRSLTPLLRGEVSVSWRHEFLVERYGDVPPAQWGVATPSANPVAMTLDDEEESEDLQKISPVAAPPYLALRTDRYLYVEYVDGERELYDLAADPYALQNLALTADPVLIADLHDALEDLRTCATASCRNAEDALAVAARDGLPIPAPG